METTFQYTKLRNTFGKQPMFVDRGPELCDSFGPDQKEQKNYMLRNPVHRQIQNTKPMSEHEVNTRRATYVNTGMNHYEGGWPKDININDPEATQRYRRKIEKDDSYIHCVMHLSHSMEHYILQNNAIDMYQMYYSELGGAGATGAERSSCRTVIVFRDPALARSRPVAALSWQADGGQRLAAAHAYLDFQGQHNSNTDCYIWDTENPNTPELVLTPPHPMFHLEYNPRDQHTLIGGLLSGQVAVFDCRRGGSPVALNPAHEAHRGPVRSALYINSKTGTEFFSAAGDGVIKWWDSRNLSLPTDSMLMDPVRGVAEEQDPARAFGVTVLEYETTIPTRYMCGTENGLVLGGNRKGKNPVEKLPYRFDAHLGPVYTIQRNPAYVKNFLTVGDWTARVWSEDCRESSIMWTHSHRTKLTDGAWNPIRFSLLLLTQYDGCLSCWDLLRRQSAPVIRAQLCDEPLTRVKPHEVGRLVACGSRKGSIYLTELSENLGTADKNDKMLLTNIFERENKRERILEARIREIRLKQRQGGEGVAGVAGVPGPGEAGDMALDDRDLREASDEYDEIVRELDKANG